MLPFLDMKISQKSIHVTETREPLEFHKYSQYAFHLASRFLTANLHHVPYVLPLSPTIMHFYSIIIALAVLTAGVRALPPRLAA